MNSFAIRVEVIQMKLTHIVSYNIRAHTKKLGKIERVSRGIWVTMSRVRLMMNQIIWSKRLRNNQLEPKHPVRNLVRDWRARIETDKLYITIKAV